MRTGDGVAINKVFFVCPRVLTGGPLNIHQVCTHLNAIGAAAQIVYHPNPEGDHTPLYSGFPHLKIAERLEDGVGNLIVIPETYTIGNAREHFPNCTIALWWLSYVNAALSGALTDNIAHHAEAIHLFQSYYAYAMVRPHLSWDTWWFFLTDHLQEAHLELNPQDFVAGKRDIVCFNGNKDNITEHLCKKANIDCIPIKGMTRSQMMETLQKCKVYVDNSFHPGKDRLPREAAMNGCVVITNKSGSAAYFEDVPIEEKVALELDLYELIPTVFADYGYYFDKQESYREAIRSEMMVFAINAENFWRRITESST